MKKILFTLTLLSITIATILAQSPQAFKYQAIARDNTGNTLADKNISIRISLIMGSTEGNILYSEVHSVITNKFGLINLEIGRGDDPSGRFSDIDWSTNNFFIKMEMDENGGTDFKLMGISQLLSVPYALYSLSSGNTSDAGGGMWKKNGSDLYYLNGNVGVGTMTPLTEFEVNGIITASGGTSDNWNTSYGWGDHTLAGYLTVETDPEVGNNTENYLSKWDGTAMISSSIFDNGSVAIGTNTPDPSAAFEVLSNDKGFLLPRLTTVEREAIPSPAPGLIIFNTEESKFQGYNGIIWQNLSMNSCAPTQPGDISGPTNLENNATGIAYSINPVVGANSYNWIVPEDVTITSGQGTIAITVNWGTQNGTVSVCTQNDCGNSGYNNLAVWMQLLDARDGQTYPTVMIGNQLWMAKNLNYETSESRCLIHEGISYCEEYGRLYNWYEAQVVCPSGWHLPNQNEWDEISISHGGSEISGGNMKEVGFSHWTTPNTGATNLYGFTALPGGTWAEGPGCYYGFTWTAFFWTTDDDGINGNYDIGLYRYIFYTSPALQKDGQFKTNGKSVRCIKN